MAPAAPAPRYNDNGTRCPEWLVVAAYRPDRDVLTLSWNRDGTLLIPTHQGAIGYPVEDLERLVEDSSATLRRLGSPRLFT